MSAPSRYDQSTLLKFDSAWFHKSETDRRLIACVLLGRLTRPGGSLAVTVCHANNARSPSAVTSRKTVPLALLVPPTDDELITHKSYWAFKARGCAWSDKDGTISRPIEVQACLLARDHSSSALRGKGVLASTIEAPFRIYCLVASKFPYEVTVCRIAQDSDGNTVMKETRVDRFELFVPNSEQLESCSAELDQMSKIRSLEAFVKYRAFQANRLADEAAKATRLLDEAAEATRLTNEAAEAADADRTSSETDDAEAMS